MVKVSILYPNTPNYTDVAPVLQISDVVLTQAAGG